MVIYISEPWTTNVHTAPAAPAAPAAAAYVVIWQQTLEDHNS
jgi:hypothetical protein